MHWTDSASQQSSDNAPDETACTDVLPKLHFTICSTTNRKVEFGRIDVDYCDQ